MDFNRGVINLSNLCMFMITKLEFLEHQKSTKAKSGVKKRVKRNLI